MSCAIVNIYFFIQLKEEITHPMWLSIINSTAVQLNTSPSYCMQPSRVLKSVFAFIQAMAQGHFPWTRLHLKLLLPSDWTHGTSSASAQVLQVPYGAWIRKLLRVKKKIKPAVPPWEMSVEPQSPKLLKTLPLEDQAPDLMLIPNLLCPRSSKQRTWISSRPVALCTWK